MPGRPSALILGLTGGIATGKTTVARMLQARGAALVDADQVSRDLMGPGSPLLFRLVERFGPEILDARGHLDRAGLARRVFGSPEELEALNQLTHPPIWREILGRVATEGARSPVVVLMAPLLLEHGAQAIVDQVWVVEVPEAEQVRRLMTRDGLTGEEASARLRAQMSAEEKSRLADVRIDNAGDLAGTEEAVSAAWETWVAPLLPRQG